MINVDQLIHLYGCDFSSYKKEGKGGERERERGREGKMTKGEQGRGDGHLHGLLRGYNFKFDYFELP